MATGKVAQMLSNTWTILKLTLFYKGFGVHLVISVGFQAEVTEFELRL